MCRMEALLLLAFPLDDKGSLTRLLLYLMEKYIDSCLRFNGQEETILYMVVIPVHVKKRQHKYTPPSLTELPSYPVVPRSRGIREPVHLTPLIYTAFPYTLTILSHSNQEQRDQRACTPPTTNLHRLPTYIGRHHMKDERR